MHPLIRTLPLLLLLALPALADVQFTVTPDRGPASGGTRVTIKGPFGSWPYTILFGSTAAASSERVADDTMIAITPAHVPGPVEVIVFEYDMGIETGSTFTFTEDGAAENFERVLLPIFTAPVFGKFGSEFHTNLILSNTNDTEVQIKGLQCESPCATDGSPDLVYPLGAGEDIHPRSLVYNGRPGRFFYVPKAKAEGIGMNLLVTDLSRALLNFGTEMPIVRESEFRNNRVVLTGIPGTTGVRNTLRIYGDTSFTALVRVDGGEPFQVRVEKPAGATQFDPAYGAFSNFPPPTPGKGWSRVTIDVMPNILTIPPIDTPIWAFITITNNETQAITTITPAP